MRNRAQGSAMSTTATLVKADSPPPRNGTDADQGAGSLAAPNLGIGAHPKVCMVGNCQAQTWRLLFRHMLDTDPVAIMDISNAKSRDETRRAAFLKEAGDADLTFVMQNRFYPVSLLREHARGSVHTIGNFVFRGLYPDVCYVGTMETRLEVPLPYHSVVVIDAFKRGVPPDECERLFTTENFLRLGLLDAWDSSQAALESRMKHVDFPLAALTVEACRNYQAMLSHNHPSIYLVYSYVKGILDQLGVAYRDLDLSVLPEPMRGHDQLFVHDVYAEHLNLPYRTTQRFKVNSLGRRFVGLREMIESWYRVYRDVPPDDLVANSPLDLVAALRNRPEMAHLIEAPAAA
jgi:hypothetical protein